MSRLSLNNLAALYNDQGRYADAEPLLKRALAIREKALGPNHPDVGVSLNNLAVLYGAQSRYADALSIVQRTISQNSANKSVAFGVLYASQSQSFMSPTQALSVSYTVLQQSTSSVAGEAVSKLAARFACWHQRTRATRAQRSGPDCRSGSPGQKHHLCCFKASRRTKCIDGRADTKAHRRNKVRTGQATGRLRSAISRLCRAIKTTTAHR